MQMASPARLKAHPVATFPQVKPRVRLPYCVEQGTNLFRQGDACSGLFEVVRGVFRLSRLTRGGRSYIVGFGFPGDILGYGPERLHISDCDAVSDAQVIRHRPGLLYDASTEPQQHLMLMKGAMQRIESMQTHCMMLGQHSARDRVAAFLSLLGQRLGVPQGQCVEFELPMLRSDIANFLGLTTETVSRSLTELRNARLISIENLHHIVLLRPQHLEALVEGVD